MILPPGISGSEVAAEKFHQIIGYAVEDKIYNRFCFVDRKSGYYRTCAFGVPACTISIFYFYLNAVTMLRKFISYFEEAAAHLIEPASQDATIYVPDYNKKVMTENEYQSALIESSPFDWESSLIETSKKLPIVEPITPREKDCLVLAAQGYTMKNIGRHLKLSPRTVETHLRNIKEKFGINTRDQLAEIWHDYYGQR